MNKICLIIEAQVNYTEDEKKVEKAITNFFPMVKLNLVKDSEDHCKFSGYSEGLEGISFFRESLKRQRIRAAARSIMLSSISNTRIKIALNRQAAYAGNISFVTNSKESSLGPILIVLEYIEPQRLIEWIVETQNS